MNDLIIFDGGFYLKIGLLEIHADAIACEDIRFGYFEIYWGNHPVIELG